MAKSAVKSKIKNMASLWNAAKEKTDGDTMGDFVPVDPGIYTMQLVGADIGEYGGALKVRTRWCVLDEGEDRGKICTQFDQCDNEEKMVWLIRLMKVMGMDLDTEPDSTEELEAMFTQKVGENLVCRVKVTEKEGYVNTRIQKVVEVDESEMVDPEEALGGKKSKGEKSSKGKKEEEKEEEAEEISLEEGDRVSWEDDDGETVEGEIVGFTADEDAKVRKDGEKKSIIKPLDALTKLDAEEKEEEKEEEAEEEKPKKSAKPAAKGKKEENEEEAEEEAEEEGRELKVGDKVVATIKGKDKSAVVKSIDAENGKVKVKVGNELHTVSADDIAFEVDE